MDSILSNIFNKYKDQFSDEEKKALLNAIRIEKANVKEYYSRVSFSEYMIKEIDTVSFQDHVKRMLINNLINTISESIDFNRDVEIEHPSTDGLINFKVKLFIEKKGDKGNAQISIQ